MNRTMPLVAVLFLAGIIGGGAMYHLEKRSSANASRTEPENRRNPEDTVAPSSNVTSNWIAADGRVDQAQLDAILSSGGPLMYNGTPEFWTSTMEKLEEKRQDDLIQGVGALGPEFRSIVEFNGTGDINRSVQGTPSVVDVGDYTIDANGERSVVIAYRSVRVMANLMVRNAVFDTRIVPSTFVVGGFDVEARFRSNIHDWAADLASIAAGSTKPEICEVGFGLAHNGMLLSRIDWAELSTKTDSATPPGDRWIKVAPALEQSYANSLKAELDQ